MNENTVACRHLARFFRISVEYNLQQEDFVLHALNSEYKQGIEQYMFQWYSQSPYYYFEEFMEENNVKIEVYNVEHISYEKERMYWLGYCLQDWSNRCKLTGKEIAQLLGARGITHMLSNYKIYHTVDALYVLQDCEECLDIKIADV